MAHIDAEDVGAGLEQLADHCAVGGSRAKRGQNLDAPLSSHACSPYCFVPGVGAGCGAAGPGVAGLGSAGKPAPGAPGGGPPGPGRPGSLGGCSLVSVNWTVQARCSPVSTSKKPVRSKPRARQFSVPLMVNSLSREHMKA